MLADHGLVIAVLILAGAAAISNGIAMMLLIRSTGGFRLDWKGYLATVAPAVVAIVAGILLRSLAAPFIANRCADIIHGNPADIQAL